MSSSGRAAPAVWRWMAIFLALIGMIMVSGLLLASPSAQARGLPALPVNQSAPTCPASDPPPGTGSQVSAADRDELVRAHNDARQVAIREYNRDLSLVRVTWDPKLACDAQAWADDPESTKEGVLHRSDPPSNRNNEGENLFAAFPGPPRPMMAMDPNCLPPGGNPEWPCSWIAQKPKFDADYNAPVVQNAPDNTNYKLWGHYSQLVWSSTTSIGCGVNPDVPVRDSKTEMIQTGWILVCRYLPAGNIHGQRAIPLGAGAQRSKSGRGPGTRSGNDAQERAVRLGCHVFCQTAAGRGGDGGGNPSDTIVGLEVENPVVAFDDGTIPVRIYCFVEQDCEGAIIIFGDDFDSDSRGRSDLLVPAGGSRLLAAPLPASAVDAIESGKRINMKVVADLDPTYKRLSPEDQSRFPDFQSLSVVVVGS
jgi:Cysteine-rich secretory protein family